MSIAEEKLEKILIENNIPYKREYSFSDLKGKTGIFLRFDFAIIVNNELKLLEIDGTQHFTKNSYFYKTEKSFLSALERDRKKNEYCIKKGIVLIRIPNDYNIKDLNFLNDESLIVKSKYHNDKIRRERAWQSFKNVI